MSTTDKRMVSTHLQIKQQAEHCPDFLEEESKPIKERGIDCLTVYQRHVQAPVFRLASFGWYVFPLPLLPVTLGV